MRLFYEEYSGDEKRQQLVAQLPWGHNILLIDKIKDKEIRKKYKLEVNKMKKKIVSITILVLILLALIILYIDKSVYKEYSKNYIYMDTYINIKINSTKNKQEIDNIFNDIDYLYSSYNKLTNRYEKYDGIVNIYYLNEILSNNEEIEIDKKLSDIINIGIEYYNKTDGLFNIAAGNLTGIWKEYINKCNSLPSNKELDVNINIDDIKLDNNKYTKYNDIKLDLGGIAKGYVTELVGNYLEDNNINNYIVNFFICKE